MDSEKMDFDQVTDVERHYGELKEQLAADGFDGDSKVMKCAKRLLRALKDDGFSFSAPVSVEPVTAPADIEPSALSDDEGAVIRAFRTKNAFDASVIESVFSSIEGWCTRFVEHKGSYFVVATNAPRLTKKRVNRAIVAYVTELKRAKVTNV